MNQLETILQQLESSPEQIEFSDIITVIDNNYHYQPARFTNGTAEECVINEAGENEGSCKIFSFAQNNKLNEQQTLHCFGQYYRDDVLKHPENTDHANIRTFIKYGWDGIRFDSKALQKK